MNHATPPSPSTYHYPMPGRLFQRYLWFWHVLSIGILTSALGFALWDARPVWGWRQAVLVGFVAAQVVLYLKVFVFNSFWPPSRLWLTVHFVGGLGLWLIEWRLDAYFFVVYWMYFGQMCANLPTLLALPATFLALLAGWGLTIGWDVSRVDWDVAVYIPISWVAFAVLFAYARHVEKASQERARLVVDLQEAQRALELARQRDAELAALRERERLARDLHDSLGHALVALSVQLEAVQRLYVVDPERASAQVEALKALTRTSMEELRRSLEGLRAPGLGCVPLAWATALCGRPCRP